MVEPRFTSEFLAEALAIRTTSNIYFQFNRLWTDSRTLEPNDFFICLSGDKFDGHDFIEEAIQKGVRGFLVREDYRNPGLKGCFVLRVPNTLIAFRKIASRWRGQFKIPVVAIAGNVGKTTTKDLLSHLLRAQFNVVKTHHSENGDVGIPKTLVSWEKGSEVSLVEIGIDEVDAMGDHLNVVKPSYGIITSLGPEHLEKLGNTATAVKEELLLFAYLQHTRGHALLNWDDPFIREWVEPGQRFYTYSLEDRTADFWGQVGTGGLRIHHQGESIELPFVSPGIHQARNLLGAVSLAWILGVPAEKMIEGLGHYQTPPNRMEIQERDGVTLMCDYYNSNPTSLEAAFQALEFQYRSSGKILVLGDMLELGRDEIHFHESLAPRIARLNPKSVYLVGPLMRTVKDKLDNLGLKGESFHFSEKDDLANQLWSEAAPGDVVLIKGSRGMRMEDILRAPQLA